MSLTTDPNDPKLGRGIDNNATPQHNVYLVLSEEEIAKGFVRPVRTSYVHTGIQPDLTGMIDLTEEEKIRYADEDYIGFIPSGNKDSSILGRFITKSNIRKGCGTLTTMNQTIAETYARDPKFYSSTYCCGCQKHLPVKEFTWDGTNEKVGS